MPARASKRTMSTLSAKCDRGSTPAAAATGRVTRKTDFAGGEAGAYSGFFAGRESATKSSRANSSLAVTESSAYETARYTSARNT